MPDKPDNYGIKLHVLAKSLSGYVWNLYRFFHATIYIKETVLNLLDNLINKGYFLYTNSFYNSVNLSELLLSKNTYVCITLRKNRGEPEEKLHPV